jgi:hypothetical protein
MTSYRLKRRHFLLGLGGMTGLRILLHNVEAIAVGTRPPPRLLVVHWPGGTVHYAFVPEGTGTAYTTSPILQPFETAGLRNDMIVLRGTSHLVACPGGGGAEGGVVKMMTGADCPGTRENGGEGDDAASGGPSFDQIFLEHVPGLRRPGLGFVNMTCDARVDSFETSSQCLSYSYETREIESSTPGGFITEHIPQLPDLSPLDTYTKLFESFAPGMTVDDATRELLLRRSVLDSSLSELGRLRALAPAAEREKLDLHEAAIRAAEVELSDAMLQPGSCLVPTAPDGTLVAPTGNTSYGSGGFGKAEVADDERLAQMGTLYFALTRAAFQCDLVRVATFQWCPSTNHVAFQGLYPADPDGAYMHHPLGSRVTPNALQSDQISGSDADIATFLVNVHTWFNQRLAEELVLFKEAEDPFGGNLLDSTVVPNMTEKEDMQDGQSGLPSLILGGRGLGLQGGQFVQFDARTNHNSVWLSVAQALGIADPLTTLSGEVFSKADASPIEGLWVAPE